MVYDLIIIQLELEEQSCLKQDNSFDAKQVPVFPNRAKINHGYLLRTVLSVTFV